MNRRLGRREVLDVKLRSSIVRATRMRWSAIVLAVSFGTVFGLHLAWRTGEWALNRFLYENRAFAIQQIDVQTDGVISAEQIRRWSGVKLGQNLLALDLASVKRYLELVPIVKAAAVERILPRSLRIHVVEREPLAQVYVPQLRPSGGYEMLVLYLDEDGCVMPPLEPRQRAVPLTQPLEQYPVIAGINFADLYPGRQIELSRECGVKAALQLIVAFDRSPMVGLDDLQRIDVSSPEILQVTTGQGSQVTFAIQDLDRQLRRWREIYDLGLRMHRGIASLDLAVTDNIPARWAGAGLVPPFSPKSINPPRAKKKNV